MPRANAEHACAPNGPTEVSKSHLRGHVKGVILVGRALHPLMRHRSMRSNVARTTQAAPKQSGLFLVPDRKAPRCSTRLPAGRCT